MPAFGVMGWAMPRVLCEALLARLARFLIILLQDALAPITSPFWRSPERSGRGISRYVRGICFSPCLPSTHPPATQNSATTLSPFPRIPPLPLPIHAINRLNFVPARMHSLGRLELHPPQF